MINNPDAQWSIRVSSVDLVAPPWSYSSYPTRFSDADSAADLPDVVLVDPLVIDFAFTDGQVPSQIEPSSITFTIWARSASKIPTTLQRGCLCEWELMVNPFIASGGVGIKNPNQLPVFAITGGRVTEAVLSLVPGSAWPARMTVKAVDLNIDLPSLTPAVYAGDTIRRKARERLVQIAGAMGINVGLPTGTPDGGNPPLFAAGIPPTNGPRMNAQWTGSARDQLTAWCNAQDVLPAGIITPYYNTTLGSYPTGYGSPVPSAWYQTPLVPPPSLVKYMVTPSTKPSPNKLPLRLANVGGELRLTNAPETDQHTAAVDGAYVEVPGVLRSGREHAPNLFRFTGAAEALNPSPPNDLAERTAQAEYGVGDYPSAGARARDLPTLIELGSYNYVDNNVGNTISAPLATYAAPFTPDAYALATPWAFDAVTIRVDKMTSMAQVRSVVSKILPSYPVSTGVGEGMDGVLIRHVTLFNMDPDTIRPSDPMPQGYVSSVRVTLQAGAMVLEVTLQPAAAPGTGTRITLAEVDAATWHGIQIQNIDHSIRLADLALVDA